MKTRNLLRVMGLMVMLALVTPSTQTFANPVPIETPEETVKRLERRLEEIKAIDKSQLSKEEKKALRGEVKQIKKEMKVAGGLYIGIGSIILIALLVILLA